MGVALASSIHDSLADDKSYISQSGVPLSSETHGGEDVGIFAQGKYIA